MSAFVRGQKARYSSSGTTRVPGAMPVTGAALGPLGNDRGEKATARGILLSPLVSQKLDILGASENAPDSSVLRELLEAGKVTPAIDRTYPLSEAATAIRYFQEGHARGKVVIAV